MHRILEISEANTTPYISKSSGNSRELLGFRKLQSWLDLVLVTSCKAEIKKKIIDILRALILIKQSPQKFFCKVCLTNLNFLAIPHMNEYWVISDSSEVTLVMMHQIA